MLFDEADTLLDVLADLLLDAAERPFDLFLEVLLDQANALLDVLADHLLEKPIRFSNCSSVCIGIGNATGLLQFCDSNA